MKRVSKFLKYTLLAISILYMAVYLAAVFNRISFPFTLKSMEGSTLDHVRRLLSGRRIYVAPSINFAPYGYTPLYYYLSAAATMVLGPGFTPFVPLRLVSFLSSIGCFSFIYFIVRKETNRWFPAILASCLFAATYKIGGAWLDLARIDSLFLFLLLAAIYTIRFHTSKRAYILGGILISLSFFTKQTALMISVPIMLYCIQKDRRLCLYFIGTIAVLIGLSSLYFNHVTNGWYGYYVFDLPRERLFRRIFSLDGSRLFRPRVKGLFIDFWLSDIAAPLPVACGMSIAYFIRKINQSGIRSCLFYLLVSAGTIASSMIPRLDFGGRENTLLPTYAILAILFGLTTHLFSEKIQKTGRKTAEIPLYILCILQFLLLHYNPLEVIPTKTDLERGKEFINTMSGIRGEVFTILYGYLPSLAGKKTYAHTAAIGNIHYGKPKIKLKEEIRKAVEEKRFAAIITTRNVAEQHLKQLEYYYKKLKPVFPNPDNSELTDFEVDPGYIYVPIEHNRTPEKHPGLEHLDGRMRVPEQTIEMEQLK